MEIVDTHDSDATAGNSGACSQTLPVQPENVCHAITGHESRLHHKRGKAFLPLRTRWDALRNCCSASLSKDKASRLPYRPLRAAKLDIRLLVLMPGRSRSPLRCSLLHRTLSQAKTDGFETISYCWGSITDLESINVDGRELAVPKSACKALRRFRLKTRKRVLWIDSVCIDQSNVEERGQQVAIMDRIYSFGKRNLIWLGPDDGTAEKALKIIQDILREAESETNDFSTLNETIRGSDGSLRFSPTRTISFDQEPLIRFYSRPWFARLWVRQEAALAAENIVFCGDVELSLLETVRCARWLHYNRQHLQDFVLAGPMLSTVADLFDVVDPDFGYFRINLPSRTPQQRFFGLLTRLRGSGASDPRDHIYGVLGIYRRFGQDELPDSLKPDYSKSIAEVFSSATRWIIMETGHLFILREVYHRLSVGDAPEHALPSWVPRWDVAYDGIKDPQEFAYFFCANGDTKVLQASVNEPQNLGTLQLAGIFVDGCDMAVINRVSVVCTNDKCFANLIDMGIAFYDPRDNAGLMTLGETLIAGRAFDRLASTDKDHKGLEALCQFRELFGSLPSRQALESSDDQTKEAAQFGLTAWQACYQRRLLITEGGRIGLGPQTMRANDIVVVLFGGKLPFVLRPVNGGEYHEFVGWCYVHGIMYGEEIIKFQEEQKAYTTFQLL